MTLVNGIINPGAVGFNSEEAMAATNLSVDRHAKVRAVVLDVSEEDCNFPIFLSAFSHPKNCTWETEKWSPPQQQLQKQEEQRFPLPDMFNGILVSPFLCT